MTRPLIVVRAGDASRHPDYAGGDYDLVVSYYGRDPARRALADHAAPGGKLGGVYALACERPALFADRPYVWLPDDDVTLPASGVGAMFELMRDYELALAQPAVTGHVNLPITRHDPSCQLRFTNFVEVMAPCFAGDLFHELLPWFHGLRFGWGLAFYWHTLAERYGRTAILDACPMEHTRPAMQGELYAAGDPYAEFRVTRKKIPLTKLPTPTELGRIPA